MKDLNSFWWVPERHESEEFRKHCEQLFQAHKKSNPNNHLKEVKSIYHRLARWRSQQNAIHKPSQMLNRNKIEQNEIDKRFEHKAIKIQNKNLWDSNTETISDLIDLKNIVSDLKSKLELVNYSVNTNSTHISDILNTLVHIKGETNKPKRPWLISRLFGLTRNNG